MTETGVPYQAGAGEQPAEKSLGQVNFEAAGYVEYRDEYGYHCYADRWDFMTDRLQEQYQSMARAVEAEVLRRAVAHMDKQLEGLQDRHLVNRDTYGGFDWAVRVLQEYARQQEGQT